MRRDTFQAIADPTRRAIIHLVAKQPLQLNALAGHFKISRPAISRHVRILKECGLLRIDKQGREHICSAHLAPLRQAADWLDQYRAFWNNKLDALDQHLSNHPHPSTHQKRKK